MTDAHKFQVTVENVDGTETTFTTHLYSIETLNGKIQVETEPGFYQFAERVEPVTDE